MKDVLFSIVYSLSFVLFAFTAGGLGALIPVKASQLDLPQTDFGTLFIFKGAGGFLGGLLGLALEKVMGLHTAMAIAFSVMGLCSLGVYLSTSLLALNMLFLFVETAGMVINICCTVCIFRIHGSKGQPWIKSLHLCYGIGAFITPLLIGQFLMVAYQIYALISVPFILFMVFTKEKNIDVAPIQMKEEGAVSEVLPSSNNIPLRFDIILAVFLMCGTGNEGSYGGWITSYGTMNKIRTKQALFGASVFWMSMTVGRGLLIPLSALLSVRQQLSILVSGILFAVTLCNLFSFLELYTIVLFVCSIITGLFMSGIYPLTMSLPSSLGLKVTPQNTSRYVLGGCIGGALIPYLIGLIMKHLGSGALFVCMIWVLFVMIAVLRRVLRMSEALAKPQTATTSQELNEQAQSPG